MSTIGGGIGAVNLAASFAGAQRTEADTDRNKEVAGERKFQVDRANALAQTVGDVADPDLSTERDADGRLPFGHPDLPEDRNPDDSGDGSSIRRAARNQDPFGERGNMLDIEV